MATRFGRFRLIERLGGGAGPGGVYRAHDTEAGRTVALRLLAPPPDDPGRVDSLVADARAASTLSHPGIVALFDVGEVDGQWFVASEFVDGEPLDCLMAGRPLSLRRALHIGVALADALAYAHACRFVHRDLRPGTVLQSRRGHPRIRDFGLARATPGGRLRHLLAADPGTVDPLAHAVAPFMSPEQVLGAAGDCRADIYALGAVLYQMLTGREPYGQRTPAETLVSILKDRPLAPSRFCRSLPEAVDRIVMECLTLDPAARPDDAAAIERGLDAALANLGSDTSAPGS